MSTQPASYQFAGLDSEMIELTQELEELGGGDAKSVGMELHYLIRKDYNQPEEQQTVWTHETSIGLRDINSKDQSIAKSMRYYSAQSSSIVSSSESFTNTETVNYIVDNSTSLLMEGFNNCILSIGPSMLGKTETMFGNLGFFKKDDNFNDSLSIQLLRSVFHRKENSKMDTEYRVGLSAWSFDGQKNTDLMVRIAETTLPLEFTIIECPTYDIAVELLNEARKRCPGALTTSPRARRMEEEKCHFFARIMVFQRDLHAIDRGTASIHTGVTSSLYLADLLGFSDIESNYYKTLPNKDKIVVRNRNLQLQGLLQLLQEMSSICRNALQYPSRPMEHMKRYAKLMESKSMTSARSSKLSKLLAPIIQGNSRTTVIGYIVDGEAQIEHTRDLVTQLQYVPEIRSAIYRIEDIPFHDLQYKSHLTVLTPHYESIPKHQFVSSTASGLVFTSNSSKPVYHPDERASEQYETIAFGGNLINVNTHIQDNQHLSVSNLTEQAAHHQKKKVSAQEINLTNLLEEECDLTNFDRTPQSGSSHSRPITEANSKDDSSQHLEEDIQRLVPEPLQSFAILLPAFEKPRQLMHESAIASKVTTSSPSRSNLLNPDKSSSSTSAIQHLMDEFHSLMHTVQNDPQTSNIPSSSSFLSSTKITVDQARVGTLPQQPLRQWPVNHYFTAQEVASAPHSSTSPIRQKIAPTGSKYHGLVLEANSLLDQSPNYEVDYRQTMNNPPSLVSSLEQLPTQGYVHPQSQSFPMAGRVPQYNQPPRLWTKSNDDLFAQFPMGIGANTAMVSNSHQSPLRVVSGSPEDDDSLNELRYSRVVSAADEIIRRSSRSSSPAMHANKNGSKAGRMRVQSSQNRPSPTTTSVDTRSRRNIHNFISGPPTSDENRDSDNTNEQLDISGHDEYDPNKELPSSICSTSEKSAASDANDSEEKFEAPNKSKPTNSVYRDKNISSSNLLQKKEDPQPYIPSRNDKPTPSIVSASAELLPLGLKTALSNAQEEIENLTRIKESLILALQNEKAHRIRLEKENQQLRDGYVEVNAQHEVESDSMRYQVQQLRNQVKKLCEQGACLDVFEAFEKDVHRLTLENQMLRETNLKLEWKLVDEDTRMEDFEVDVVKLADIANASNDEEKDILERRRKMQQQWNRNATKQKTLMERLKSSGKERETWKQEYEKLKLKERQFIVAERMKDDNSRRLKKAFYDLQVTKKESDQRNLQLLEMERQNNILKHDLEQFQKSDEQIRTERDRLLSEVAELRTKIRFFEAEDQRVAKLHKFVSKHSSSSSSQTTSYANTKGSTSGVYMSGGIQMNRRITDKPSSRQYSQPPPPPLPFTQQTPLNEHSISQPRSATNATKSSFSNDKHREMSSAGISNIQTSRWSCEAAAMEDSIARNAPSLLPMFQQLAANVHYS